MANGFSFARFVIGLVLIGGGVFLYTEQGPGLLNQSAVGNQPCLNSVIAPYSASTICGGLPTQINAMLYTDGPTSSTGIWSGGQVASQGGFIKAYYFLSNGATVRTSSLEWFITNGPVNPVQTSLGTDPTTGLTWIGGQLPVAATAPGIPVTIVADLTDSYGVSVNGYATFDYTAAPTYAVQITVIDTTNALLAGQSPPVPNVQVRIVSASDGSTVGQLITNGNGYRTIFLPAGSYIADATPPPGYNTPGGHAFTTGGPLGSTEAFTIEVTKPVQTTTTLTSTSCPTITSPFSGNPLGITGTCTIKTVTQTSTQNTAPSTTTSTTGSSSSTTSSTCGQQTIVSTTLETHTTNLIITTITNTITATGSSVVNVPCTPGGGPNQTLGIVLSILGAVSLVSSFISTKKLARG